MHLLYQTVKEIIDTGRVGVPVFIRFIVQITPIEEQIIDILAQTLVMTGSWLGAVPSKIYVQHKENTAQITATAEYTGGQTAIVSVNVSGEFNSRIDLMLLGNKGALYHDGEIMPKGFDLKAEPMIIPKWLIEIIERSLYTGEPIILEEVLDFD